MRKSHFILGLLSAVVALAVGSAPANSRKPVSSATIPVHMVVTVEAKHGKQVPVVSREDVMVYQGHDHNRAEVTGWLPLQGDHAGLELFLLLDDASNVEIGPQLQDLRRFIDSQPATATIGVGYMRDGAVDIAQNLTSEHVQAAKALRLPLGNIGASASPYLSIVDLIKRWPESRVRREILMLSDGIDRLGGVGPGNPYVDSAIEQAQRAGIIIYTIYASGAGHYGHSFWRINWGQNYLSELTDRTGGEAYFLGFDTPVSFAPYLDDVTHRLTHQYLLEFLAKPEKKAGLQSVKLRAEEPNAELVAAEKVYVPAGSE